jgi:transcriptional regulator with XRE-family HTH domain
VVFDQHKLLSYIAMKCKELRLKHQITQENFLYDTGIHIGRIECAKRDISISTMMKICTYFEISIEEFFKDY